MLPPRELGCAALPRGLISKECLRWNFSNPTHRKNPRWMGHPALPFLPPRSATAEDPGPPPFYRGQIPGQRPEGSWPGTNCKENCEPRHPVIYLLGSREQNENSRLIAQKHRGSRGRTTVSMRAVRLA